MGKKRVHGNFAFFGKYDWYVPGVADVIILLLLLFAGSLVGNVITVVFMLTMGADAAMEYGMIVAYPVMFIPPMLYASSKSRRNGIDKPGFKLDSGNYSPVGGALCAVIAVVCCLSASVLTDALNTLLPPMPEWLEETFRRMTSGNFWFNFISVSIFAPFFEEWLCRGMVLRGLLGKGMKPVWAILVSAAFFALIHLNPWQALPAFTLGCLFGYVYYKTGSLKLTMLMHFANNTFALVCGHIDALKDVESMIDLLGAKWYALVACCCVLLLCLGIMAYRKIQPVSPKGNMDVREPLFSD